MPILVVTDNPIVQNSGTVDEQYSGSAISRILQNNANYNYSGPADAGGVGNFSTENSSTVFKFAGLSNLPAGAEIISATLYFFAGGGFGSQAVEARQLLRNAPIDQLTWNNWSTGNAWATGGATGSGDSSAPTGATTTVSSGATYYGVDVTDDVQAYADGTVANYGWLIRAAVQDAGSGFRFINKQTDADGSRPELVVSYNAVPQPAIDSVTGAIRVGGSIVIATSNMDTITSVTLGGQALTITDTDTDEVTATIPTSIALLWGGSFTLLVDDGTDDATLASQTLLSRTGWTAVVYAGPEPDDVTTEGFYEYAEVYRTFSAAVGDQVQFTDFTGMTVATNWLPTISPAAFATGTYAIYDVSAGTRLSEQPYTIAQDISLLQGGAGSNRISLKMGLGL